MSSSAVPAVGGSDADRFPPRRADGVVVASGESARRDPPRFMQQVRNAIRLKHLSRRTEEAYAGWIRRFILFHDKRHPRDDGRAGGGGVPVVAGHRARASAPPPRTRPWRPCCSSTSTSWARQLGWVDGVARRQAPATASSRPDARRGAGVLLAQLRTASRLVAALLYGSGLRLLEALRLRIKDLDLEQARAPRSRRQGPEGPRAPCSPGSLVEPLREHLRARRGAITKSDPRAAPAASLSPDALTRKYPNAAASWRWQWLFPATRTYRHRDDRPASAATTSTRPSSSAPCKTAAQRARITKPASPPHPPPQLRHPPPRRRLRHPHHPGTPGPPRRHHHHDLHPRPQPRPRRRPQPPRPLMAAASAPGLCRLHAVLIGLGGEARAWSKRRKRTVSARAHDGFDREWDPGRNGTVGAGRALGNAVELLVRQRRGLARDERNGEGKDRCGPRSPSRTDLPAFDLRR